MYKKIFNKHRTAEDEVSYSLTRYALKSLQADKMAMVALWFIVLISLMAIFAYLFIPDKSPYANRQILEIGCKSPGFKMKMLKVSKNEPLNDRSILKSMFNGFPDTYYYLPVESVNFKFPYVQVQKYSGWKGIPGMETNVLVSDVVCAVSLDKKYNLEKDKLIFKDIYGQTCKLTRQEVEAQIKDNHIETQRFWLGTDPMGRDYFSRLVLGARVSLSVGMISVLISLIVGLVIGLIGGYYGGRVDNFIMWLINVIWSMPTLLLVIAITFVLGKGFWQIFIAVGLTMWVEVARVVRGQVLSVKEQEFIDAARVLGYSNTRIIFKHIMPNVLAPVIVISAANFASAILLEAGLSFLGIGVQPPMPSWGSMVKDYYGYLLLDKAYLAVLPGLCIMLVVLSFMVLGNGLRDALDTKKIK